jgi:hypothetical protein
VRAGSQLPQHNQETVSQKWRERGDNASDLTIQKETKPCGSRDSDSEGFNQKLQCAHEMRNLADMPSCGFVKQDGLNAV